MIGLVSDNDGTVFSSMSAIGTVSVYDGETGVIRWVTAVPANGSTTYTVGNALTIIGYGPSGYVTVLTQRSGTPHQVPMPIII